MYRKYILVSWNFWFFWFQTLWRLQLLQQWKNFFFFKTQEMVDNLLKIVYFHQKKSLCIHYLCTNISSKFWNIRWDIFFFKFTKITFFQAVKLAVPFKLFQSRCRWLHSNSYISVNNAHTFMKFWQNIFEMIYFQKMK